MERAQVQLLGQRQIVRRFQAALVHRYQEDVRLERGQHIERDHVPQRDAVLQLAALVRLAEELQLIGAELQPRDEALQPQVKVRNGAPHKARVLKHVLQRGHDKVLGKVRDQLFGAVLLLVATFYVNVAHQLRVVFMLEEHSADALVQRHEDLEQVNFTVQQPVAVIHERNGNGNLDSMVDVVVERILLLQLHADRVVVLLGGQQDFVHVVALANGLELIELFNVSLLAKQIPRKLEIVQLLQVPGGLLDVVSQAVEQGALVIVDLHPFQKVGKRRRPVVIIHKGPQQPHLLRRQPQRATHQQRIKLLRLHRRFVRIGQRPQLVPRKRKPAVHQQRVVLRYNRQRIVHARVLGNLLVARIVPGPQDLPVPAGDLRHRLRPDALDRNETGVRGHPAVVRLYQIIRNPTLVSVPPVLAAALRVVLVRNDLAAYVQKGSVRDEDQLGAPTLHLRDKVLQLEKSLPGHSAQIAHLDLVGRAVQVATQLVIVH
uniref:(northern house mosquito) hypothetical protein n=1 Tax=Culex pipiens TaxID=7175 RepID=A0A8D8FIZ9_CULPI